MRAVVQRIISFPVPKTEYRAREDGANSHWGEHAKDATFYRDFEKAVFPSRPA